MSLVVNLLTIILSGLIVGVSAYYTMHNLRVLCKDLGRRWQWFASVVDCKPLACNVCMGIWASLPYLIYMCYCGWATLSQFPLILSLAAGVAIRIAR